MALSADEWTELDRVLSDPDAGDQVLAQLRQRFPHLAWTRCDASDVIDAPFRTYLQFDVHLLDGTGHCAQITADPTRATGIVLATRKAVP